MTSFEEIQNSWLAQPVNAKTGPDALSSVQSKWDKRQRKVRLTGIGVSAGFLLAMCGIAWVYTIFRNQYSWPFDVSIAAIYGIMLVFLVVTWKSYGFRKASMDMAAGDYIRYQLKKLHWQRKVLTTYIWIYAILLWLALCLYIPEVTKKASLTFTIVALAITTAYILGIMFWNKFYKQKKQVAAIDEIVLELRHLLDEIER